MPPDPPSKSAPPALRKIWGSTNTPIETLATRLTKRMLDALEMLFYHLAAFRVNFPVVFMDLHTNELSR